MDGMGSFYYVQSMGQAGRIAELEKEVATLKKALAGDEAARQALTTAPEAAVEPAQSSACGMGVDLMIVFMFLLVGFVVFRIAMRSRS